MSQALRRGRPWFPFAVVLSLLGALIALSPVSHGQEGAIPPENVQACLDCHADAMGENTSAVHAEALKKSPHKDLTCQDCHSAITGVVEGAHTPAMLEGKASCADCHSAEHDEWAAGVHARKDIRAGDHPTCVSCHGNGDPHAVIPIASWTKAAKTENCMGCHADVAKMKPYGVDPDASESYEASFHGKALLRFGHEKAAGCVDCHQSHAVLSPSDPKAPTFRANAAATCGQAGCHPGAKMNFAMSGANHLLLKEKQSTFLRAESAFFEILTVGTIVFLLIGVALDLRRQVFGGGREPKAGRFTGFLVSISFLFLVVAVGASYLGKPGAVFGVIALALMLAAFIWYLAGPKKPKHEGPRYVRITKPMQWQHILLAVSFTALALTGMPLRFAETEWLHNVQLLFGGFHGARIVHRIAAVVMIISWVWHTIYLFVLWKRQKWSLKAWNIVPNLKDVRDFIQVSKYYLHLSHEEPKYDRFQFREKFDYFAVYWGMPVMVFSGLVLWFPVYFANRLPEIATSVAYIAHSDEAILAFLAIVMWHLYNVHFNPQAFPMSDTWLTRTKTEEEMEREHPLELERIRGQKPVEPPDGGEAEGAPSA